VSVFIGFKLTDKVWEISEQLDKLSDLVQRHESRRRFVSQSRGYEVGHVADWYPREISKTAIKREIRKTRKLLMELSNMLDHEPGVME